MIANRNTLVAHCILYCRFLSHFEPFAYTTGLGAGLVAVDVAELLRGVRLDPNDDDVAYFVVGLLGIKSRAVRA